jgi:hypothetical protein
VQAIDYAMDKGGLGQLRRNEELESHSHLRELRDEAIKHPGALDGINAHINDYMRKFPPIEQKKGPP